MDLTPDKLQAMAVSVVTRYMTKQASMSESVAQEAKAGDLNPEQIKRLIEASNSIAYLRQLQDSADKTFEFPVAEYKDVLTSLVTSGQPPAPVSGEAKVTERQAPIQPDQVVDPFEPSEQEKVAMVAREVVRVRGQLTKMAYDKSETCMNILTLAPVLRKDPLAFEKIAYVVEESDFDKMLALVGIEKKASANNVLFRDSDLESTKNLYNLLKSAEQLVEKEAHFKDLEKRANSILMEKQALIGFIGKGLGWATGALSKKVGSMASNATSGSLAMSKTLKQGAEANKAAAVSKGLDPKDAKKFTRKDAHAQWNEYAAKHGTAAAHENFGWKPTVLNRMSTSTKLTIATAPLMAQPGASAWDRLHPGQKQQENGLQPSSPATY